MNTGVSDDVVGDLHNNHFNVTLSKICPLLETKSGMCFNASAVFLLHGFFHVELVEPLYNQQHPNNSFFMFE